jgi:hypothetical protein
MAMVIILGATEANQVRGPSDAAPTLAALQPVALLDGTFYLGTETLADPDFARHHALLSGLSRVDFDSIQALLPLPAG